MDRNTKFQSWPSGFTTVELLVVVAVMLIALAAAVDIFSLVSRTQKRIYASQQVQGDVRFAFETMVRDIHLGLVDYTYYQDNSIALVDGGGVVQPLTLLALRDSTNQPLQYRLNSATNSLEVSRGAVTSWQPLLSATVAVTNLRFYIVPATNPFVPCGSGGVDCVGVPNEQPRVTLVLTAQNIPTGAEALATFWLQTTTLTRTYRR